MRIQKFYSMIASIEGKKSQVSIGNIREIVKVIRNLLVRLTGLDLYKIIRKI